MQIGFIERDLRRAFRSPRSELTLVGALPVVPASLGSYCREEAPAEDLACTR